jgi:DNA invertase Pin-like site-specific DNA recombinase
MLTAALYIRVSTDKQEELSPDAQKRLLHEYAEKNNILVSDEYVYIEGGISGKKADKRPKFQRMIGLAKSKDHPFDVILVWKYSRFARNQEESILYKSLLKRNNIDVISISEPLIEGPFGSLIERIIEWMDEYYSIRLSGEVIRGMSEKALRGGYMSAAPLGYANKAPGSPPVIVPEEAEVVKTIFNKFVNEGITMFQIARQFNEIGLKTRSGKPYQRRSIDYILQNPMYIGYVRWNRQHHSSHTVKSKEDWIISKGTHEPIISEDIFNAAQERIKRELRPWKSRPITDYKHWLTGIIKCDYCKKALVASSTSNPNITTFQCSNYGKGKCESNSVSSNILVPAIMGYLQNVINSGVVDYTVKADDKQIDVSLLEQQLNKLNTKEERIKAAYINGIDTMEEYKKNKDLITSERRFIEKQISDLRVDLGHNHKPEMLRRVKELYKILNDETIDKTAKNRALAAVVERITYNKRELKVKVYFYYK